MNLQEEHKKQIADEFKVVSALIREEKDILRKTFYFSGTQGVVQRILNLEFNSELVLMHTILQSVYNALNVRLQTIIGGQERVIQIPDVTLAKLADYLEELSNAIRQDKDIFQPLAKISQVGYVTTGNGYYLYQKGILKL